ncbi:MAG: glycosyltransferase [Rhodobacteraceae bacterium]|nr:glycosyltransferase [Paracoccaceae bacterium]
MSAHPDVAAIVIGRNEGQRLRRCLTSLQGQVGQLIYVDSGSTDGSSDLAAGLGASVIRLDPSRPFTAARGRQEGFQALAASGAPDFVQFVDGDCAVEPGWIAAGRTALVDDPKLGLVTGWRSEVAPGDSIYNALCDFEWHRPAGDIQTCGGDMMVRCTAFNAAGGFRADVIAAEDDEFCARLGHAGWKLRRLPLAMTRHDAAMSRFSEWWRRAIRSGHGFAQVGHLHPHWFRAERRRVLAYGAMLPVLALAGLIWSGWLVVLVVGLYALSYGRTLQGLMRAGLPAANAAHQGLFLSLSKFPNLIGMALYHWRVMRGRAMQIIEYK